MDKIKQKQVELSVLDTAMIHMLFWRLRSCKMKNTSHYKLMENSSYIRLVFSTTSSDLGQRDGVLQIKQMSV